MGNNKLGLIALIALVAGNMMGSGILLLPSELATLGSISLYAWIFSTIGAICLALVFTRLFALFPKTGGPYAYTRQVLGPLAGFQAAYNYWLAMWVGNTAVVVAAVGYLQIFFPGLDNRMAALVMGWVIIWFTTFINIRGFKEIGFVQIVMTVVKLIPLFIVIIFGWFFIHPAYYHQYTNISQPHHGAFVVLSLAIVLTFWSFLGLESATVPAENIANPKRNVPLATILGLLLTSAVYILSTTVVFGMVKAPYLAHSTSPFADAANVIMGHWGYWVVGVGAIATCLGCLNGWIMMQGQVAMAAANDRLFPQIFAKQNDHELPVYALLFSSLCMSVLLLMTAFQSLIEQFQAIILFSTFANLIAYLYASVADFVLLKRREPTVKYPKLRSAITTIAIIFTLWAIFSSGERTVLVGIFLLAISFPVYFLFVKKKAE